MRKNEERVCWLCGRNGNGDPLDRHHIFNGPYRKKSEKYKLVVFLCHSRCHEFGPKAVHNNAETMLKLKRWGQLKAMQENGWSVSDFREVFGKNYLDIDESAESVVQYEAEKELNLDCPVVW